MLIPERCLARLRASGLDVSDPYSSNHLVYPDGVAIFKPATTIGNAIPGFESYDAVTGQLFDAPSLALHAENGRWIVTSHDIIPGPGPGDFVDVWDTPEQAVDDILAFFLGDPRRMEVKRRVREGAD